MGYDVATIKLRRRMSDPVKIALIIGGLIGGAIVIATILWIYFSPFEICRRHVSATLPEMNPESYCLNSVYRRR
jgi:hypothetical protein